MKDGRTPTRRAGARRGDVARRRGKGDAAKHTGKAKLRTSKAKPLRSRPRELDQFNTQPWVAAYLFPFVQELFGDGTYQMVEPSAGKGAFLDVMPADTIAYDLDVQREGVIEKDFLTVQIGTDPDKTVLVGNPPFGTRAEKAIAFFKHAAPQVCAIAMIFPTTFRKASVENRLDRSYHLVREIEVPRNAFEFEGKVKHVPSVFQIWVRRSEPRALRKRERRHPDFEVGRTSEGSDFAIQRIGADAGTVKDNLEQNENSHYFIKGDVRAIMEGIDFRSIAANTAGCPSLAIAEIIEEYRKAVGRRARKKRRLPSPRKKASRWIRLSRVRLLKRRTPMPQTIKDLHRIRRECRRLVTTRSLMSAGAAVVPIPGADILADVGLLTTLLPDISKKFGLDHDQVEKLDPRIAERVFVVAASMGNNVIGRMVTKRLVTSLLKRVGARVATASVARYVPVIGSGLAAAISFGAMKLVGNAHIDDCYRTARSLL